MHGKDRGGKEEGYREVREEVAHLARVGSDKVVQLDHERLLLAELYTSGEILEHLGDEDELALGGIRGLVLDEAKVLGHNNGGVDKAQEDQVAEQKVGVNPMQVLVLDSLVANLLEDVPQLAILK